MRCASSCRPPWSSVSPPVRVAASALALVAVAVLVTSSLGGTSAAYVVRPLVTDRQDPQLVNAWGLAASPNGPWWVANEARNSSTLYSGSGRKQLLTVSVPGGPTGVVYSGGQRFVEHAGGRSAPARFIYACEDGRIRAWTPTVPNGWSKQAEVTVDDSGAAAVFRGLALAHGLLYATDVHNARVDVFDGAWRRVGVPGGFDDASIPSWYAPDGIAAFGNRIFVTYVWRAPVDGNDAPSGGFVDEFDLRGRLVAHVGHVNEPWGLALAPASFGRYSRDLLVASFGDGQIVAFRQTASGWTRDGVLADPHRSPLHVDGVWGIAFGNGGMAGPTGTLFAAAGPHSWRGASELAVHGLLAAI